MDYIYLVGVSSIGLNIGDAYVHGAHYAIECLKRTNIMDSAFPLLCLFFSIRWKLPFYFVAG